MTQPLNLGNCCGPSIAGIRKITFRDGDQAGLIGLDAVMEALYKEGKPADDSTILAMITPLAGKELYQPQPERPRNFIKKLC